MVSLIAGDFFDVLAFPGFSLRAGGLTRMYFETAFQIDRFLVTVSSGTIK